MTNVAEKNLWRVPAVDNTFGEYLDLPKEMKHVIVLHRGPGGWSTHPAMAHTYLRHQIYTEELTPILLDQRVLEIVAVCLDTGRWQTIWAFSDGEVSHPSGKPRIEPSKPKAIPQGSSEEFAAHYESILNRAKDPELCHLFWDAGEHFGRNSQMEKVEAAFDEMRDAILHGRSALDGVLDSEQTNAVLGELDAFFEGVKQP